MTTWQEDLQRACAASFAAWGNLVEAWSTATVGMWASVVDWAVDEQVAAPPNATAFLLHADHPTRLHGAFVRADDPAAGPIDPALVTFDPPRVPAMPPGAALTVVVRIEPAAAAGVADAGYVGHVVDDAGAALTSTPVYVAVHVP